MTIQTYAYYNIKTGLIENSLAIDDEIAQTLIWPEGYAIVLIQPEINGSWSMCGIGWSYIDGQFIEPPKPEINIDAQPTSSGVQTL